MVGQEIEFLRFGKPPESGYSYNYQSNRNEAGVSCYVVINGKVAATVRGEFEDRQAYIGRGILLGFGGDDEALVQIISIRKISGKKADRMR